jgi:hypothetical protein
MDRRRKPAMRAGGGSTRGAWDDGWDDADHDLAYDDDLDDGEEYVVHGGFRFLRRTWALIRWVALIFIVGAGVAAVIALAAGGLVTLIDSSL